LYRQKLHLEFATLCRELPALCRQLSSCKLHNVFTQAPEIGCHELGGKATIKPCGSHRAERA